MTTTTFFPIFPKSKSAVVWEGPAIVSRIAFILLLTCTLSAHAFDNDRTGFVLGGGLGLSPAIRLSEQVTWMTVNQTIAREVTEQTKIGGNLHLLVGWGFDTANTLSLYNDLNVYTQDQRRRMTLFMGLVWHHYFQFNTTRMFTAAGLGLYHYLPENTPPANAAGPGLLLGFGSLLSSHLQLGVYLSHGASSAVDGRFEIDRDHLSLSVAVSAIAF